MFTNSNCRGFIFKLIRLFCQPIFLAKRCEPFIPVFRFGVRHPADLCHAFGAGVDRVIIGLAEMIRAAHDAIPRDAVMHREHMSGLMRRDLDRSQQKRVKIRILMQPLQRPDTDTVFHARLTENVAHRLVRI